MLYDTYGEEYLAFLEDLNDMLETPIEKDGVEITAMKLDFM